MYVRFTEGWDKGFPQKTIGEKAKRRADIPWKDDDKV